MSIDDSLRKLISFPNAAREHNLLAQACLTYMCYEEVVGAYDSPAQLDAQFIRFPFLQYAATAFPRHVRWSENISDGLDVLLKRLFDPSSDHWHLYGDWCEQRLNTKSPKPRHPTSLCYAVLGRLSNIVEWLLSQGVDINATGGGCGTALQVAALLGDKDTVKILIEHGADVNLQAGSYGFPIIADAVSPWKIEELTQILLSAGAQPSVATKSGFTALHYAVMNGNEAAVKILIDNSADANFQSRNGFSPLHEAVIRGNVGIARFLLEDGADGVADSKGGISPFDFAIIQGHLEVAELLLHNRPNISLQFAMYLAAMGGQKKSVEFFD